MADDLQDVANRYSVALTKNIVELIGSGNESDPIARQFIPTRAELDSDITELKDPVGDDIHSPVKGLVHRYPDRALLKPTSVCPVYCRYCFRREMVGNNGAGNLTADELDACFDYLRSQTGVWELILSGGDPLILSPRRLQQIFTRAAAIEHIRVLRIHTRVPVADPARINAELVDTLRAAGRPVFVVLHTNHARELYPEACDACSRLVDAGIPMLSQSVLLRGVNDDAGILEDLLRNLVECRIRPYYLHHCDLAPGTAHFRTSIEAGQQLLRELRGRVSGLCQPTYVLDIPGGAGKSPVGPTYLSAGDTAPDGSISYQVEDFAGTNHNYVCCGSHPPAD